MEGKPCNRWLSDFGWCGDASDWGADFKTRLSRYLTDCTKCAATTTQNSFPSGNVQSPGAQSPVDYSTVSLEQENYFNGSQVQAVATSLPLSERGGWKSR